MAPTLAEPDFNSWLYFENPRSHLHDQRDRITEKRDPKVGEKTKISSERYGRNQ
jgi:hypothetical protein